MTNRGRGQMYQRHKGQALRDSITEACQKFHTRYGVWPTLVTVNDEELAKSGIPARAELVGERRTPASHVHCWGIPQERSIK